MGLGRFGAAALLNMDKCDKVEEVRAKNAGLEILDLMEMVPGFMKEDTFREALSKMDWKKYEGKNVLVKGCGGVPMPTWAYMAVTARLARVAKSISYGEVKDPIPVF